MPIVHSEPVNVTATASLFTGTDIWRSDPELAFSSWMTLQKNGKGFAESTAKAYLALWRQYLLWLSKRGHNVVDVDRQALGAFLEELHVRRQQRERYHRLIERVLDDIHAHTFGTYNQARAATVLRGIGWRDTEANEPMSFLGHVLREQLVAYGNAIPDADMKWRRGPAGQRQFFTAAWRAVRNRAAIALLLGAGLKVSEALSVTVYCINTEHGPWLSAPRRQGPPRRVRLEAFAQHWLDRWLLVRRAAGLDNQPDAPLLCGDAGAGHVMHPATLSRVVSSFGAAAAPGHSARVTAQILRNEYAARLVDAGACPAEIAERMGYADVVTAERLTAALAAWRRDHPDA